MQNFHQPIPLTPGYRLQNWYEIGRVLGRGNVGVTYQAHDRNLERDVAIKEYLPGRLAVRDSGVFVQPSDRQNEDAYHIGLEAFLKEARTLAKLEHPNVPSIINVFMAHNTAYMVMSLEEGQALNSILQRRRILEEGELLNLLVPLLSALERLHEISHIHGDLSPDHILVRADGSPVLLDFGGTRRVVAKLTHAQQAPSAYLPLEICFRKKDQIGPRADIYGLAAVLYRAVAGVNPPDALERRRCLLNESRDPLVPCLQVGGQRYSENLLRMIDSGLRLDCEERPESISAWRRDFDSSRAAGLDGRPRADSESGLAALGRRLWRGWNGQESHAGPIAGGIAAAALLALGAYAWFGRGDETPSAEPRAAQPVTVIAPAPVTPTVTSVPAAPPAPPAPAAPAAPAVAVPNPVPAAETANQTPPPAPQASEEDLLNAKVLALVSAARDAMDAGRLLSPADDNAVAKFRAALALSPDHEEALQGLRRIAEGLIVKGQEASRRRDFAKAQAYLDQAGSVLPDLSKLASARKELHALMLEASQPRPEDSAKPTDAASRATRLAAAARRSIARGKWQKAEAEIGKIAALLPEFEELPRLREELAVAKERQPAETTPPPDEPAASTERELQTDLKRARTALQRHHLDKAEFYVDKAAALDPDSDSVAALQIELYRAREEAKTAATPPPEKAQAAAPLPAKVTIRQARVSLPAASPGQTIEFETAFELELPQGETERQVTATWTLTHKGRRIGKQGEASMPLAAGTHSTRTELEIPATMKPGTYVVEHRVVAGNSRHAARSSFQVTRP